MIPNQERMGMGSLHDRRHDGKMVRIQSEAGTAIV